MADAIHTDEIWKPIPFALDYAASNWGNVKRIAPDLRGNCPPQNLKLIPHTTGRLIVTLRINRKSINHRVHRLVAAAFFGMPPSGCPMVCHKDGNHLNNRPENLYYGNEVTNGADKARHGTAPKGEANFRAKVTEEQVRAIRADNRLLREIAADYGLTKSGVFDIKKRKAWKHVT